MKRRTFLKWATAGLGGLVGLVLGIPAVAYLLDPRNRKARERAFKTVRRFGDLKADEPQQVILSDTFSDAWTLHPNEIIGRVWLVRRPRKDEQVTLTGLTLAEVPASSAWERLGATGEPPAEAVARLLGLPAGQGQVIQALAPESAALQAGVRVGDILLKVGGKEVSSDAAEFAKAIDAVKPGAPVDVVVLRAIDAFTTICPHLGCSINHTHGANRFICPCHNGTFTLSGVKVPDEQLEYTNPVPRGMDALDLQLVEDPDPSHVVDDPRIPGQQVRDLLVRVRYQNFRQGEHAQIVKS